MNEQQLAAVKQAVEALRFALHVGFDESNERQIKKGDKAVQQHQQTITALQSIIRQDALHKMAEESRTSGLRLDDWDKIGCVNHDCDQCKAVQEPFGWYYMEHGEIRDVEWTRQKPTYEGNWKPLYTTPPAQPAVQREHITDGRPCWCNPDVAYVDPETGAAVIVHKEPQ